MTAKKLDPLSRLAVRHGPDKFGAHLYTPIYHKLFSQLRDMPVRILEIGIGGYETPTAGGGSLRMWADYFQFAKIVGLDTVAKDLDLPSRVSIVQGSQIDLALLQGITDEHGPFDIVIDDGSHVVDHALATFRFLYPRMPVGGIYVVEDTQTAFLPLTGGNPSGHDTIFSFAHAISLAMHRREGYAISPDDELAKLGDITHAISFYLNLIVFERGENDYPSNLNFQFDHAKVQEVYHSIEREAASNPASRDCLSRIDMAIWGHRPDTAVELAIRAANSYPGDRELLAELVRLMEWAGRNETADALRARLSPISNG